MISTEVLKERWQKHIGRRRHWRLSPRRIAALGTMSNGPTEDGFIELDRLVQLVLFDEDIGRHQPALRLVGYGASFVAHGVEFGGVENAKFYVDLNVEPAEKGTGLQFDATKTELFQMALQLHRDLHRVDRHARRSALS